jgi:hypothetical protein
MAVGLELPAGARLVLIRCSNEGQITAGFSALTSERKARQLSESTVSPPQPQLTTGRTILNPALPAQLVAGPESGKLTQDLLHRRHDRRPVRIGRDLDQRQAFGGGLLPHATREYRVSLQKALHSRPRGGIIDSLKPFLTRSTRLLTISNQPDRSANVGPQQRRKQLRALDQRRHPSEVAGRDVFHHNVKPRPRDFTNTSAAASGVSATSSTNDLNTGIRPRWS